MGFTIEGVQPKAFEGRSQQGEPIAKGSHVVEIVGADIDVAKKDGETPVMRGIFEVKTEGEDENRKLYRTYTLTPRAAGFTIQLLKAAQVGYEYDESTGALSFEPNELLGREIVVDVKHRKWKNEYGEFVTMCDVLGERAIGDGSNGATEEAAPEPEPAPTPAPKAAAVKTAGIVKAPAPAAKPAATKPSSRMALR